MSLIKKVKKFCLDLPDEKQEYEDLMNNTDAFIIDTKLINGQGKEPIVFVVVYWFEDVLED